MIAESVKSPDLLTCRWISRLVENVRVKAPLLAAGSQDSGECKESGLSKLPLDFKISRQCRSPA